MRGNLVHLPYDLLFHYGSFWPMHIFMQMTKQCYFFAAFTYHRAVMKHCHLSNMKTSSLVLMGMNGINRRLCLCLLCCRQSYPEYNQTAGYSSCYQNADSATVRHEISWCSCKILKVLVHTIMVRFYLLMQPTLFTQ